MRKNWRKLILVLLAGFFVMSLSAKVLDKELTDFTLKDLSGKEYTLSKIEGLVILDFWATWCPPCKAEIPHLQNYYTKYGKKGLTIVGVSNEKVEVVSKFKKDMADKGINLTYVMLIDPKGEVMQKYKIEGIPTTYFINKDGKVLKKEVGFDAAMLPEFEKIIKANLKK